MERAPEWVAYDAALQTYNDAMAAYDKAVLERAAAESSRVERAKRARINAERVSNEIEAEYFRRKSRIDTFVADYLNGLGLIQSEDGSTGIITVDPDRIIDTRFYFATYVTDWGWESAPSPVTDMLEIDQNDKVTVTIAAPPAGRNIQKWRLYRSNVGTQSAAFQFVSEQPVASTSYLDELKGEQLGEVCPTLSWLEPPKRVDSASPATIKPIKGADPYLKGIVGMPNGIIAGFIDNFVAFCDPYHPYAWPVEYQITTDYPIVGLGVFGQSLFVGTMANPYIISGADSASMTAEKLDADQACVSRRSIASVGGGVIYASPDGLCLASATGVQLVTGELFSREDWQALTPSSIIGATHEGVYYFWTSAGCFALDFMAKKLGKVEIDATAVHKDVVTDHLFAVVGTKIVKLFSESRRTATWKSGRIVLGSHASLAWVQVDGDQLIAKPVTVRWYGDGALRHTATLTDIQPQRLPPGRWLEHEVEIESAARLTKVMLASSTDELKGA